MKKKNARAQKEKAEDHKERTYGEGRNIVFGVFLTHVIAYLLHELILLIGIPRLKVILRWWLSHDERKTALLLEGGPSQKTRKKIAAHAQTHGLLTCAQSWTFPRPVSPLHSSAREPWRRMLARTLLSPSLTLSSPALPSSTDATSLTPRVRFKPPRYISIDNSSLFKPRFYTGDKAKGIASPSWCSLQACQLRIGAIEVAQLFLVISGSCRALFRSFYPDIRVLTLFCVVFLLFASGWTSFGCGIAELKKIALATGIGFAAMGFIGFAVKIVFMPINNILIGG